jgi:putative ABC transport system permease protein
MIEALLLVALGGALGGALAYLYCNGASVSTLNFNTFSQVTLDFRVTPTLLLQGFVWAVVIGAVGGLPRNPGRPAPRHHGPSHPVEPSAPG